jgi:hypothetical protein
MAFQFGKTVLATTLSITALISGIAYASGTSPAFAQSTAPTKKTTIANKKPVPVKPAATKPAATKPAATKPAATKPTTTKPTTAKPATSINPTTPQKP